MNNINEIISVARTKAKKRVGRGNSAKGGNTSGRGNNGQKARTGGSIPARFEGGQTPFWKRIGKKKGFMHHRKINVVSINLKELAELATAGTLTIDAMVAKQVLKKGEKLKILGHGDVISAINVQAHHVSKSALAKIEKAGGKVEMIPVKEKKK
jgi:large subunit ribosomal protein L15